MKKELAKLYEEYCKFVEDNWKRVDIGADRVNSVKNNFRLFMTWLEHGEDTYFI